MRLFALKLRKKNLKATFDFNKKVAMRFHKRDFYEYEQDRIKNLWETHLEKSKLSTPHSPIVDEVINEYTQFGLTQEIKVFRILTNIRDKNIREVDNPPKHQDLINIVANPFMLIAAYRTIRKNQGALTHAHFLPSHILNNFSDSQKNLYAQNYDLPDGMSWEKISAISSSILKGEYPWGCSRRIWIPKPGRKDSLRPITIPPFCDKIVQESIRMVLEAIYEPTFKHMGVAFGFRASAGCHHNIVLIQNNSQGFTTAVEGDIEEAYPKLDNDILLSILGERIKDQRFLNLLRKRLNISLFDTKEKKYLKSFLGIPQGGIDSPYLFNIYYLGMDSFILKRVQELLDKENSLRLKRPNGRAPVNKAYSRIRAVIASRKKKIGVHKIKFKEAIKSFKIRPNPLTTAKLNKEKKLIFSTWKEIQELENQKRRTSYRDPSTNKLRFLYTRYADDFVILGNFSLGLAQRIKEELKNWLKKNRNAQLSDKKTFITNLKEKPAKFLGFELKATNNRRQRYVKRTGIIYKQRTAGWELNISPDKERMINRLFMKGYCNRKGFPIHIPWLSGFEPHIIIKKFSDVMSGTANYYANFISNNAYLSRWLYIIRYSAIKTLAQKYNTTISKTIKKFGHGSSNQISARYLCFAKDRKGNPYTLSKSWRLLSQSDAIKMAPKDLNREIGEELKNAKKGQFIIPYPKPDILRTPRIMDADFLERMNWVNIRTQASFDLPCAKCGSISQVEMHHIKHVRKTKYSLIPKPDTLRRLMSLRNRRQVPLCRTCHMEVHSGKGNVTFNCKNPVIPLFDNRILDSERYIHKCSPYVFESLPFKESLLEKGWKEVS